MSIQVVASGRFLHAEVIDNGVIPSFLSLPVSLHRPCTVTHQNCLAGHTFYSSYMHCFFTCKKQPRGLSTDTLPPDPSDVSPCHIGELCPLESLVETQAGIVGGCEEQDTGCS